MRAAHTVSTVDLFNNFNVDKLKGIGNIKKKYKSGCKKFLAAKIFLRFIEMMLEDFVEGDIFYLPTSNLATFSFKPIKNKDFTRAYKSGKFGELDFLISNFTIYVPIFRYFYRKSFHTRNIVLSKQYKERMLEKTNTGYKYC